VTALSFTQFCVQRRALFLKSVLRVALLLADKYVTKQRFNID